MWDDVKYGGHDKDEFEKVALVGATKWVEWAVKISGYFMEGKVKTFPREQLPEAWDWIKSEALTR